MSCMWPTGRMEWGQVMVLWGPHLWGVSFLRTQTQPRGPEAEPPATTRMWPWLRVNRAPSLQPQPLAAGVGFRPQRRSPSALQVVGLGAEQVLLVEC